MRSEPRAAAPPSRRIDPATGLRSTVETAVGGAVAATLEQVRLAFRAAKAGEQPVPPAELVWNRLLTGTMGKGLAGERSEEAAARWRTLFEKEIREKLAAGGTTVCAGPAPWPLVHAIAGHQNAVVVVARGPRAAEVAADDLAGCGNVSVIRHDRGLGPIRDESADAVLCLFEALNQIPAETVALLRECHRVLRPGGVAAVGYADLALPESQEALARGAPSECFANRPAIETLARLAGFGRFEFASGVLPTTSIAWLTRRAGSGGGKPS
jgi:SAM-dependent methyltransferase